MAASRPAGARRRAPSEAEVRGRAGRRALPLHRLSQDRRGGAGCGDPSPGRRSRRAARRRGASARALAKVDGVAKLTGSGALRRRRAARPTRCWLRAVRSPHAHARFTLGDLAPLHARASRARARADRRRRAGRNGFGIYPDRQGPAGPRRRRTCAIAARRCCALVGDARRRSRRFATTSCRSPGSRCRRSRRRRGAGADGAPALHAHAPGNVLCRGRVARGDVDGRARRRRRRVAEVSCRNRLRRARLYRARGRLRAPRRRPHRDRRLHPDALHGPRRDGADPAASRRSRCASCRRPAAAASAASSTSRCSR